MLRCLPSWVPAKMLASWTWLPIFMGASDGQAVPHFEGPIGFRALDAEGGLHVLGERPLSRGVCIVFLGIGCPVSNELLPELNRLSTVAAGESVEFFGVVSDQHSALGELIELRDKYDVRFPLLFDANGELAERLGPRTTPEAFLHDAHGSLLYRGRIDDRSGLKRIGDNQPKERDLLGAMEALGQGRPLQVRQTGPIGCAFENWPEPEALELSWLRHIAPILQANCVDCHCDGGAAPFSLERYEDAARRSRMIARVAVERTMPPWNAVSGFGDIADARTIDRRAIRTLELWALSGAQRGVATSDGALEAPKASSDMGPPDLIMEMPEPFLIPPDGPDLFRAFPLLHPILEERFVRAIEYRPRSPCAVRSAMLFSDPSGRAKSLDADSEDPGYDSSNGLGLDVYRLLALWPVGKSMEALPLGVGRKIESGSDLVLWIHAHPQGVETREQGAVAIWFSTCREAWESELMIADMEGAQRFQEHEGARILAQHDLEAPLRILALIPRLGYLGMGMKVSATLPDGNEVPILWLNRWDVFRPTRYQLRSPLDLPSGTRLMIEARIDGSGRSPAFATLPPPMMPLSKDVADSGAWCFIEFAKH